MNALTRAGSRSTAELGGVEQDAGAKAEPSKQ